jgi:hypothetical protein
MRIGSYVVASTALALSCTASVAFATTTTYDLDPAGWNAAVGSSVAFGGSYSNGDGSPITVDFGELVFGASLVFENGVPGSNDLEVQAFDGANNLLGTVDGTRHDFVGFTSTDGIASLVVHGLTFGPIPGVCNPCVANTEFDTVRISGEALPPADTPEPASFAILGAGLAGLGFLRRRKRT